MGNAHSDIGLKPLLEIRDLHIEGRADEAWLPIIKGVNVTLRQGEVLGLIGESGAGKSTLGLAAMGFTRDGCRITNGTITFDGVDLRNASAATGRSIRGKRIAYVSQSAAASFNPAHRLLDQYCETPVKHGVKTRTEAEKDAFEFFDRMQLPDPRAIGFRYPHQVSGGQLQRAMTAMAMSCRPDIIIFDEPTTALDVTTQIEVLAAIRDIVAQFNTAAIYITHDLAVVAQMADRIKVLLYGEEVEEAETQRMLTSPKENYTKSLWAVRSYASPERTAPDDTETPVISVRDVCASYGQLQVLSNVSFDVHRKRTVAIVGESGSGKSTAARVITGLLEPDKGEVLYNGVPLPTNFHKRSVSQLQRVQMIYQMADTALNPKHRIRDIIGHSARTFCGLRGKVLNERVRELLKLIELEPDEYIDRTPSEISGGQKQRIGIARALAAEPEFIICDEVTSALDQLVAEGILRLLDRLQDELGLSYMFITHDLATVRAIADEVVVMKGGVVVEQGQKSTVFQPPHHDYTKLLLSSVPEMDPKWLDKLLKQRDA